MAQLQDKVAIVTGASSGIGRAAAKLFAAEGARVVVTARRGEDLDRLVAEIRQDGGEAVAVAGDIREAATAAAAVEAAERVFGGLDIGFNNAGTVGEMAPVADLSSEAWHATVDTNLTSAYLGARYQIPALLARGGGNLLFTSTFVGHTVGMPGMAAYAASKAGVLGLMRALAAEHGPQGIRVNAILPGGTDTAMNIATAPDADPGLQDFIDSLHALKRMARPEEIARSALHLVSDAASFVTGAAFLVDGGVSISRT